jgi:alpha-galactosidase
MCRKTLSFSRILIAAAVGLSLYCAPRISGPAVLEDNFIRLEVTPSSGLAVAYKHQDGTVPLATGTEPAFLLVDADGKRIPFGMKEKERFDCPDDDPLGPGKGIKLTLSSSAYPAFAGLLLDVSLSIHDAHPGVVVGRVDARGLDGEALSVLKGTRFFAMSARADLADKNLAPEDFYLFQGAVYGEGSWYTKIKLTPDYDAPNSTITDGDKQRDSGGFPLNYLWTDRSGLVLAHIDTTHRVAALPLKVRADRSVELALERPAEFLRPDKSGNYQGLPVMIGAFQGDYFQAVRSYGQLLQRGGFRFSAAPPAAYESIWCSWGFERELVPEDILRTIAEVKKLSIPWVVMDDGFQASMGAWPLDKKKFPRGDADIRALVDSIHAAGMKAKLWWVPMNVQPDDPLYAEHPDWVALDKEGNPKKNGWWNCYQLCPAHRPVIEQQRALVRRFMADWGFDGFKMDGACMGMVAPCYNPAHNHSRPEEAGEAVQQLFAVIKNEAESIKPGCVLEVCECGIPHNPFKMPYYNQQVSADPLSSDQVRARIKLYRALLGRGAAPYGDHVELSTGSGRKTGESGSDFASSLALGGVIGSKFTKLVKEGTPWKKYYGHRAHWDHWFGLYHRLRLFEGEYLNLYDIAYDLPETHVVAKGDTLYYGIFAVNYSGKAPLRGLKAGQKYALTEYDRDDNPLGEVAGGPEAALDCTVKGHLCVRAVPLP